MFKKGLAVFVICPCDNASHEYVFHCALLAQDQLPEGVPEVLVEVGVDDGVAGRVGVGQPPRDGDYAGKDGAGRTQAQNLQ